MITLKNQNPVDIYDLSYDELLENLQGNILKGHGRNFTSHIFVRFYKNNKTVAKKWLRDFSEKITSCKKQLKDTVLFKKNGISGGIFVGFYITHDGYDYLESKTDFLTSMKNAKLEDPDVKDWEDGYQENIHAMLLIADDDYDILQKQKQVFIEELNQFSQILKIENGNVIRNSDGEGIEHFGYTDGISQPLFFREEIEEYTKKYSGHLAFNPQFPLSQVLYKDPFANNDMAFGSFLVFRKLEQDVKGFKKQERHIAEMMDLKDNEIVGAVMVGRFEDGTPYILSKKDGIMDNLTNNFNYPSSSEEKCPFLNHIRATNERDKTSRSIIMARRGIPYGRVTDIEDTKEKKGLLFMSFQSNIQNQFEASQLRANRMKDPIIGQKTTFKAQASCFGENKEGEDINFQSFVTLKGGEYFFAPSIDYLKNI